MLSFWQAGPKHPENNAKRSWAPPLKPASDISRPSSLSCGPARPRAKRSMQPCSRPRARHKSEIGGILTAMKRPVRNAQPLRKFPGRIVLLGAGKMGFAMLEGWLAQGLDPRKLVILEPQPVNAVKSLRRRGVALNPKGKSTAATAIVIAVKPQSAPDALGALAPFVGRSTLAISIMAGRTIAFVETRLPPHTAIVRAMPNTPASI